MHFQDLFNSRAAISAVAYGPLYQVCNDTALHLYRLAVGEQIKSSASVHVSKVHLHLLIVELRDETCFEAPGGECHRSVLAIHQHLFYGSQVSHNLWMCSNTSIDFGLFFNRVFLQSPGSQGFLAQFTSQAFLYRARTCFHYVE